MQVEPQQIIPLVYNLTDPSDSGTYYVQAVIRNSTTGAILSTKNLTSTVTGRYTGSVNAPADATGFGAHIDVTISVYTDAAHTTLSDSYIRSIDKYIVRKTTQSFGGMSGADIDYARIKKIIDDSISAAFKSFVIPPTDLSPVMTHLAALKSQIANIKIPDMPVIPKTDLTLVIEKVEDAVSVLSHLIDNIKLPEQKETDLTPVTAALSDIRKAVTALPGALSKEKESIVGSIDKSFAALNTANQERSQKIAEAVSGIVSNAPVKAKKPNPILDKYFPAQS